MGSIVAVIPARMGSSRFPGKPLAKLLGCTMLEHVFRRTSACPLVQKVLVATCDFEIVRAVETFGGQAVMTSAAHERASDRVAEAATAENADIVVMVQGDEPMIQPTMISTALMPMLSDPSVACVNLAAPIRTFEEALDPNTIKVVIARDGTALYFSREAIPTISNQGFSPGSWFKQVCVIPFRRAALRRFSELPPSELEIAESIDMLRFLEYRIPVLMVPTDVQTHAVDTLEDLRLVESLLEHDSFTATYLEAK